MTDTQRLMHDTVQARDRAAELVASLRAAKLRSEANLAELGHSDAFKRVTGRSAMDNAIASAQRMVDALERAAETLCKDTRAEVHQTN